MNPELIRDILNRESRFYMEKFMDKFPKLTTNDVKKDHLINEIAGLFPPDSQYTDTKRVGIELMIQSIAETWRELPLCVLERLHEKCLMKENQLVPSKSKVQSDEMEKSLRDDCFLGIWENNTPNVKDLQKIADLQNDYNKWKMPKELKEDIDKMLKSSCKTFFDFGWAMARKYFKY